MHFFKKPKVNEVNADISINLNIFLLTFGSVFKLLFSRINSSPYFKLYFFINNKDIIKVNGFTNKIYL